jgi:DNA-binding IclR family transcriptional regulator
MDSKIPMILEILSDGKWHEIKELQQRMELDEYKVQEITAFLNKYNFATLDDDNKKVKINRGFQKFLAQTTT